MLRHGALHLREGQKIGRDGLSGEEKGNAKREEIQRGSRDNDE